MFKPFIDFYMSQINYYTIALFMAIESSFIPFPSEIVIPPAAWKAANGELNVYFVILSGTIGSIVGALFNYYIALWLGRKVVYSLAETRLARLCMISSQSVQKAENYFIKYGRSSTFFGRLIPAVRQLISLPAGLARMNMRDFLIFTTLGAGLWNAVLAALGYFMYSQKERLEKYYSEISWAMIILGVAFVLYLIIKAMRYKKTATAK